MSQIHRYGPSLVLAVVGVLALLFGPSILRDLAYADQQGRIAEAYDRLKSGPLVELNESFRSVARAVEPSVVHIAVRKRISTSRNDLPFENEPEDDLFRRFFPDPFGQPVPRGPQRRPPQGDPRDDYEQYNVPQDVGNGSGWVYEHGGGKKYIVTNHHVVEDADELVVKFYDKSTAKAKVIGADPSTDIAVLEVPSTKQLYPAKISDATIKQGDIVFAFGSPFQFEFSMSQGIVSANSRQLGILDRWERVEGRLRRVQSGYENFIQTDAAINPGNSGGPLTNLYGEVIGMNSAIASRTGSNSGLGFAIPVDMIRNVANQLIEDGQVHRGYLGVYIKELEPDLARSFGYEGAGVFVRDITGADSPAARAGMRSGDIITHIEGKPTGDPEELRRIVAVIKPGKTVQVKAVREGKEMTFDVQLEALPDTAPTARNRPQPNGDRPERAEDESSQVLLKLGFEKLATMSAELAQRVGLTYHPGVLVERVRPLSVAEDKFVGPGMVITEVDGRSVQNVRELIGAFAQADVSKGVRIKVVAPDGSNDYIVLKLSE